MRKYIIYALIFASSCKLLNSTATVRYWLIYGAVCALLVLLIGWVGYKTVGEHRAVVRGLRCAK